MMFDSFSPKSKSNSCSKLPRSFGPNLKEVSLGEYLIEKDSALSPLSEIDENEDQFLPNIYNENVMIYSSRTEESNFYSIRDQVLQTENTYSFEDVIFH